MIKAKATAVSAAASTITKMLAVAPVSWLGSARLKATKFRLAALSINSIPIRVSMALRLVTTTVRPKANRIIPVMR